MTRSLSYARILVTIPALWVLFIPPIADLNESHIYNPLWPGHARFHTFWLITTTSLSSLLAAWLMWKGPRAGTREAILNAASIMGAVLGGFFVATALRPIYDGTLSDPTTGAATAAQLDGNLVAFSVLLVILFSGVVLARRPAA